MKCGLLLPRPLFFEGCSPCSLRQFSGKHHLGSTSLSVSSAHGTVDEMAAGPSTKSIARGKFGLFAFCQTGLWKIYLTNRSHTYDEKPQQAVCSCCASALRSCVHLCKTAAT